MKLDLQTSSILLFSGDLKMTESAIKFQNQFAGDIIIYTKVESHSWRVRLFRFRRKFQGLIHEYHLMLQILNIMEGNGILKHKKVTPSAA